MQQNCSQDAQRHSQDPQRGSKRDPKSTKLVKKLLSERMACSTSLLMRFLHASSHNWTRFRKCSTCVSTRVIYGTKRTFQLLQPTRFRHRSLINVASFWAPKTTTNLMKLGNESIANTCSSTRLETRIPRGSPGVPLGTEGYRRVP